jgi:hypothetical protein
MGVYARGNSMSNTSSAQLSELRDLANQNIGQLNRAASGWFEMVRRSLDAAEANIAALCDHAQQLAQAESPVECVKLQTEFLKASMASMQKQSTGLIRAGKEAAE